MYELRQYQKDILNKLWQSLKEHDKVLVSAPTGAGKTVMASALIHELVKRENKIAFVVDSEELIKQTERTLNTTVSVVKAGYDKLFSADNPIQIIMLQTFFARADKLPDMNLDYIVIDEVHVGWQKARMNELLRIYSDAKIIGLSATPINSKGYLLEGFEDFINKVQTADLIKFGYLAKPICYAPQNCVIDLSNVSLVGNEYNSKEVDEIVLDLNKVEQIVDNWEQVAKHKKTIVFANSIKHAEMIFREFLRRGYDDLGIVHSKIENLALKRQEMLSKRIIINCNVLTKGYDDKTIECVVLARPTNVLSLYLQICGRGLRVTDTKKECLILDCANCISKHGLPDDYRFYQFAPKRDNEPEYQQCPECGNIERVGVKVCSVCGYDFTPIIEGGSSKVSKKEIERLVKLHSAQEDLLKELRKLVVERGYKTGYSWWLFKDLLQNAKTQNTGMTFYKKIMRRIEKCREKQYKIAWLKYQ